MSPSATLAAAHEAYSAKRYDAAEAACRELLAAGPGDGALCLLLGMALYHTGRQPEAVDWLSEAARLQPQSADVLRALGCAYSRMENHARAADCFARSLALNPRNPDACYGMGNASQRMGQLEQAISFYRLAIELNPQDFESLNNLGKTFKDLNRLDEAIASYRAALRIRPDFALTHGNLAIALLAAGRLDEGLREYEWRWSLNGQRVASRPYSQPLWGGEPMHGQTLFVHAEQGFGDMIQFVRFVSLARARAARTILECPPPLRRLFEHSHCADSFVAVGDAIPPFDGYIPLLSLPRVLGTTLETVPNETPYLTPPRSAAPLDAPAGHLRVGLAWAGSPKHHDDSARSISLRQLLSLLEIPRVAFYSLQTPVPPGDDSLLLSLLQVKDLSGRLFDFYDTAAAIGQLDVVISVDTAVAHLAGALGKPVWVFLPYSPDWRWLLHRPDSPWYPSMRLFRQTQVGDWTPAIEAVARTLLQLALEPAPGRTSSS